MTVVDRRYGVAEGLAIKVACRVASSVNTVLAGLQTIDGVALADGDRVLVWQQTDATENGIYSASSGNWTRTADWDGTLDVAPGTRVFIYAGTVGAGVEFYVTTTTDPIVIGTTEVNLAALSAANSVPPRIITTAGNVDIGVTNTVVAFMQVTPQAVNVNLPAAAARTGLVLSLEDWAGVADAYPKTVIPAAGDTIDGLAQALLDNAYAVMQLRPRSGGWQIIS